MGLGQENLSLLYANNKGADQPAHASMQSNQHLCYHFIEQYYV